MLVYIHTHSHSRIIIILMCMLRKITQKSKQIENLLTFFVLFLLAHIIESIGICIWYLVRTEECNMHIIAVSQSQLSFSTIITEGNKITCLLAFSLAIFFVKNNWNTAGVNVNNTQVTHIMLCHLSISLSHTGTQLRGILGAKTHTVIANMRKKSNLHKKIFIDIARTTAIICGVG